MKTQTNRQKGFSPVLVIIVIAIVVGALFFLNQKKTMPVSETTGTQQTAQSGPAIQNDNDLMAASSDLDKSDTSSMESELTQLNTDTSGF